jgi:6-pyruvoyl-tetrahydropterin synthase
MGVRSVIVHKESDLYKSRHLHNNTKDHHRCPIMPLLFVNKLTVIDCSVLDPIRGLIGASWSVDIELLGELDQQGMVFDFAKVKKTIKELIDREVDHKLLIPTQYPGCQLQDHEQTRIEFVDQSQQRVVHLSPASAICKVPSEQVTPSEVIKLLTELIIANLPSNISELKIQLHEEQVPGRYYCYSHGLKKHDGNCQRIAHGHRSQIQIMRDGRRDDQLENLIAENWKDIYLGTTEDIVEENEQYIRFAYKSDQGEFSLQLPRERVHLMNSETTVECIAEHLLEIVKTELASDATEPKILIRAFEGIGKGAVAKN